MDKRNLATVLWFVAGWWGGSLAVGLMELPSFLSLFPGILAAGFVRWDPTGVLWSRSATGRRIVPINEFADTLAGESGQSAGETDRTRV